MTVRPARSSLSWLRLLAAVAAAAAGGCGGAATIRFVSLHPSAIDPPPVELFEYDARECCWWIDDAGVVNLAMRSDKDNPWLGRLGRNQLTAVFKLDQPPAGSGRNYTVGPGRVDVLLDAALEMHRFESIAGIVGVERPAPDRLTGSFRVWAAHRPGPTVMMLFNHSTGNYLFFGRFTARQDRLRGEAIAAALAPPPPASMPASRPAVTQPVTSPAATP